MYGQFLHRALPVPDLRASLATASPAPRYKPEPGGGGLKATAAQRSNEWGNLPRINRNNFGYTGRGWVKSQDGTRNRTTGGTFFLLPQNNGFQHTAALIQNKRPRIIDLAFAGNGRA